MPEDGESDLLGDLHDLLLDILKLLNQNEVDDEEVPGLEIEEIARKLFSLWGISPHDPRIAPAVHLLMDRELAGRELDARYAWTRGRILGERYRITTAGKSYLLKWIRDPGRIY